ncbi:uncharacterized protein CTRU02_200150 [Colletotrichum truncatum]|uniref:Uncharacterized protein n=1 Tax=Colletotrichum truncatum TaxID=5467 RepID=A0ACC3ZDX3_COLTU
MSDKDGSGLYHQSRNLACPRSPWRSRNLLRAPLCCVEEPTIVVAALAGFVSPLPVRNTSVTCLWLCCLPYLAESLSFPLDIADPSVISFFWSLPYPRPQRNRPADTKSILPGLVLHRTAMGRLGEKKKRVTHALRNTICSRGHPGACCFRAGRISRTGMTQPCCDRSSAARFALGGQLAVGWRNPRSSRQWPSAPLSSHCPKKQ